MMILFVSNIVISLQEDIHVLKQLMKYFVDTELSLEDDSSSESPLLDKLCHTTYKQICIWCQNSYGFLLADACELYIDELGKLCTL